jgi:hypothetical protein
MRSTAYTRNCSDQAATSPNHANDDLHSQFPLVVGRLDAQPPVVARRAVHAADHERAHAVGQCAVDVVDLDDARHLDRRTAGRRRDGPSGERFQGIGADPVLPADADGLEPAVVHVAPHGLDVEPEQRRDLLELPAAVESDHRRFVSEV